MAKKGILNRLGTYLLSGALLTGISYSEARAQVKDFGVDMGVSTGTKLYEIIFGKGKVPEKNGKKRTVNPIYAEEELTVAGNGVFLTSYANPSRVSNEGSYDLTKKFHSKDRITYRALTSYKIKQILDNSNANPSVKAVINKIRKRMDKNSKEDYQKFSAAVKDGRLKPDELKQIHRGIFSYLVTTGKQAVVGFFEVGREKTSELEKKAATEEKPKEIPKEFQIPVPEVIAPIAPAYDAKPDTSHKTLQDTVANAPVDSAKIAKEMEYLKEVTEAEIKMLEKRSELKTIKIDAPLVKVQLPDTSYEEREKKPKEARRNEFYPEDLPPRDSTKTFPRKIRERKPGEARRNEFYPEDLEEAAGKDSSKIKLPGIDVEIRKDIVIAKKVERKLETRIGLEAGLGTNKEVVIGGFFEFPLTKWLSLEGFGNYYAIKGKSTFTDFGTQLNQRERELIGPATYKQRTDETIFTAEDKIFAEAGAGLTFKIAYGIGVPLKIGAGLLKREKNIEGKSTIIFERNGQLLQEPSVITNTKKESPAVKSELMLSAGARYNLGKNLSVETSVVRIGRKNSGRINLRVGF